MSEMFGVCPPLFYVEEVCPLMRELHLSINFSSVQDAFAGLVDGSFIAGISVIG